MSVQAFLAWPGRLVAGVLILLLQSYRYLLSPFFAHRCRYHPSCSAYGLEALRRHGAARGGALTLWRLLRCHPWGGEGLDPVPERVPGVRERPAAR